MEPVAAFLEHFDLSALIFYLTQGVIALFCIVIHEMSHGYAALLMGDCTAKAQGRLSFNPLRHIDPLGLLLMMTAGFGWAKPVPVDMRRFRRPKSGMAVTALAGPVSNLVLAWVALLVVRVCFFTVDIGGDAAYVAAAGVVSFCARMAMLSVGLGVFNLIPIPPLDGSKVLFSLLPDGIYLTILRYERYVMLVLFAVVFAGVLDGPLYVVRRGVLRLLCVAAGLPVGLFG